jgi:uncharacterized glyoxalase superfamily protein PhnB
LDQLCELEFNVDTVDDDFARLEQLNVEIVKPLTTQPWGNRSFYFRDKKRWKVQYV